MGRLSPLFRITFGLVLLTCSILILVDLLQLLPGSRDPLLENMDRERIPEMWERLAEANRMWIHPGLLG